MKSNDVIDAAKERLLEAERVIGQALALSRFALAQAEEENRKLHSTIRRSELLIFTEREFAQRLKVSKSTIARLRKKGVIKPLMVGNQIRYSSTLLAEVDEIFSLPARSNRRRR
jgi:excisionase family DNA binding protein